MEVFITTLIYTMAMLFTANLYYSKQDKNYKSKSEALLLGLFWFITIPIILIVYIFKAIAEVFIFIDDRD